ncbi:hypothetical protein TNCV_4399841 [Trichonephila clavipes]|nr:hypothetical protein TNCV_4399841 [Trichonephila clavipes]
MALNGSLPQINLGVQGETQGVSTQSLTNVYFVNIIADQLHPFMTTVFPVGGGVYQQDNVSKELQGWNSQRNGLGTFWSSICHVKSLDGPLIEELDCSKLTGMVPVAFPARPRHALLAKDLVTWQAMVGRHILEDIVGRVTQYVDEHYPVDKWHLGDLIAWVAQSSTYLRAVKVP